MPAHRIAPDGTACFAASHLRLFCLPMSHEKDARLIWVKLLNADIQLDALVRMHLAQKEVDILWRLLSCHINQASNSELIRIIRCTRLYKL